MTNKEILQKAIEKAIEKGYKFPTITEWPYIYNQFGGGFDISTEDGTSPETIIFSHDFAKAFWGEGRHGYTEIRYEVVGCEECKLEGFPPDGFKPLPCWQHHLQQMVISEDPIKYLEQFLD